jgi:hypothetical protein
MEGSNRCKRVLVKEGERHHERNMVSTVKWRVVVVLVWFEDVFGEKVLDLQKLLTPVL